MRRNSQPITSLPSLYILLHLCRCPPRRRCQRHLSSQQCPHLMVPSTPPQCSRRFLCAQTASWTLTHGLGPQPSWSRPLLDASRTAADATAVDTWAWPMLGVDSGNARGAWAATIGGTHPTAKRPPCAAACSRSIDCAGVDTDCSCLLRVVRGAHPPHREHHHIPALPITSAPDATNILTPSTHTTAPPFFKLPTPYTAL